jgi:predicted ATPase
MNQMDHLYVVTGGPGSGKSTLIEALAASGVPGISRAPRPVRIGDDRMTETTALHHAPSGRCRRFLRALRFLSDLCAESLKRSTGNPQNKSPTLRVPYIN